jgi:hypothetical protein
MKSDTETTLQSSQTLIQQTTILNPKSFIFFYRDRAMIVPNLHKTTCNILTGRNTLSLLLAHHDHSTQYVVVNEVDTNYTMAIITM